MAHYARVGLDNIVIEVVVLNNDAVTTDGVDDEAKALEILNHAIQDETDRWIRTSYNNNIRGKYAGAGFYYDEDEDIFYGPSPYPSWTRSGTEWIPPVPYVNGYYWDEDNQIWVQPEKPPAMVSWTWQEYWGPGEEARPQAVWAPPIPYPGPCDHMEDGGRAQLPPFYTWDEDSGSWVPEEEFVPPPEPE